MEKLTDGELKARASAVLGGAEVGLAPIIKGGSSRNFYRVRIADGRSFILMHHFGGKEEDLYYTGIARFLKKIAVPVPEVVAEDVEAHVVMMEDVGAKDLHAFSGEAWPAVRGRYAAVLQASRTLHAWQGTDLPATMPGFDARLYDWEHDYFLEHCVGRCFGLKLEPSRETALKQELAGLREEMLGLPASLVHRDFQSQNILMEGGRPYFIDFQGLRTGTFCYDLASLIWDPYVAFSPELRGELENLASGIYSDLLPAGQMRPALRLSAVQRLMQALGAYGNLGLNLGKKSFLKHIPAALQNMELCLAEMPQANILRELVGEMRGSGPVAA
jgi:aminoglycoside/choline kinase family phosphotransferase